MKTAFVLIGFVMTAALAGCNPADPESAGSAFTGTPVTVVTATQRRVESLERSIGKLNAPTAPAIAAETPGRVRKVLVDAGAKVNLGDILAELDDEVQRNSQLAAQANTERIEGLLENQKKTVSRFEDLVRRDLASESSLDDAAAQQAALKAQLDEALARLADAECNLRNTRIRSPVAGIVQSKRISVGDFVAVGQPLFDVVDSSRLQAITPFPETIATELRVGQKVYVAPVRSESESIEASITELRPQIGLQNRSVDIIIEFDNPGNWRPGGSVAVAVVVDTREQSTTVPAECVVRRPAGIVVYTVENGLARESEIELGVQSGAWVEILKGLQPGESVIRQGAGFMTDGAPVDIKQSGQ